MMTKDPLHDCSYYCFPPFVSPTLCLDWRLILDPLFLFEYLSAYRRMICRSLLEQGRGTRSIAGLGAGMDLRFLIYWIEIH